VLASLLPASTWTTSTARAWESQRSEGGLGAKLQVPRVTASGRGRRARWELRVGLFRAHVRTRHLAQHSHSAGLGGGAKAAQRGQAGRALGMRAPRHGQDARLRRLSRASCKIQSLAFTTAERRTSADSGRGWEADLLTWRGGPRGPAGRLRGPGGRAAQGPPAQRCLWARPWDK